MELRSAAIGTAPDSQCADHSPLDSEGGKASAFNSVSTQIASAVLAAHVTDTTVVDNVFLNGEEVLINGVLQGPDLRLLDGSWVSRLGKWRAGGSPIAPARRGRRKRSLHREGPAVSHRAGLFRPRTGVIPPHG